MTFKEFSKLISGMTDDQLRNAPDLVDDENEKTWAQEDAQKELEARERRAEVARAFEQSETGKFIYGK